MIRGMRRVRAVGWGALLPAAMLFLCEPAFGCGGFFCDSANVVNQTAERIVFARQGDGTVIQIVEVVYAGDAEKFAWVLPVPGAPEPGVSSVQALDQLQSNTNPRYTLNTETETCRNIAIGSADSAGIPLGGGYQNDGGVDRGVTVLDSGKIGAFDYDTISVDDPDHPASAALSWLSDHGYDVGDIGEAVLEPYLANGLNLIAFKLQKGASTGAIQPISLRFPAHGESEPRMVIPIRPTAVAAAEDRKSVV